jgi:hypothetical protein
MPFCPALATGRELPLSEIPTALSLLSRYWEAKRGADAMPRRADLDPLDLKPLPGWISLVEIRPASPRFVFRLFGSNLGHRPTGVKNGGSLDDLRPIEYRDIAAQQYQCVAETGLPKLFEMTIEFSERQFVYRRLTLPLGNDRKTPDMLLLGAHFDPRARELFFDTYEQERAQRVT